MFVTSQVDDESDEEDDADWASHTLKFEKTAADRRYVAVLSNCEGLVQCFAALCALDALSGLSC